VQDAFALCEQHLDFPSLPPRGAIGFVLAASCRGHLRERAGVFGQQRARAQITIKFAGPVKQRGSVIHHRTFAGQHLASRAEVDLALVTIIFLLSLSLSARICPRNKSARHVTANEPFQPKHLS
jgi:hypothetical protein